MLIFIMKNMTNNTMYGVQVLHTFYNSATNLYTHSSK